MRIRVVRRPSQPSIDGIRLDQFEPGMEYDLGSRLGGLFLAEGWGVPIVARTQNGARMKPVASNAAAAADPPNLQRETHLALTDEVAPDRAADFARHRGPTRTPRG